MNFNLDFLYYQEEQNLGRRDQKMEEYDDDIDDFGDFMKNESLENVVKMIILAYKEKYAQHKYLSTSLYKSGSFKIKTIPPEWKTEHDWYKPKEKIDREDIEYLFMNCILDESLSKVATHLNRLELVFVEGQNIATMKSAITMALEGTNFTVVSDTLSSFIVEVEESPILKLEIEPKKFIMHINRDKWVTYYGL